MTAFEWKTFFVWRVTYICVHVTQAQFLPTSSKHVSPGMRFLGLGIGGLSHQSCMSLHIGTNNIVGGSISIVEICLCFHCHLKVYTMILSYFAGEYMQFPSDGSTCRKVGFPHINGLVQKYVTQWELNFQGKNWYINIFKMYTSINNHFRLQHFKRNLLN